MPCSIETYFRVIGELGARVQATDGQGDFLSPAEGFVRALDVAAHAKRDKARIYFIGNGGSAGISSHMAADWMKNGGFSAMSLNDGATLTCLGNDLGFDEIFAKQIEIQGRRGDLLVAISSSGNSADILRGVRTARHMGMQVITLSGFVASNELRRLGDINFYVPSERYGFVEIAHLALCHAMLDASMGMNVGSSIVP